LDLYKKIDTDLDAGNEPDPILNFLGLVATPLNVINSKLTNAEKNEMDRELNIREFYQSVKATKINSTPVVDEISDRFIHYINIQLNATKLGC
jgi:hypothetical protein